MNSEPDLIAEYVSGAWLCACGHRACHHNGPLYATGLGTRQRGCDDCNCAWYCPEQSDGCRCMCHSPNQPPRMVCVREGRCVLCGVRIDGSESGSLGTGANR